MIPFLFFIGFVAYSVYSMLLYTSAYKTTSWFLYACLLCAIIANASYVLISKRVPTASNLFLIALLWDLMLITVQVGYPILNGLIPAKPLLFVGVGMVIAGTILVNSQLQWVVKLDKEPNWSQTSKYWLAEGLNVTTIDKQIHFFLCILKALRVDSPFQLLEWSYKIWQK